MNTQFATGAVRAPLSGGRWHFQHGPIDLVLQTWGRADECGRAYEQAWARFESVLPELVSELPTLRQPVVPAKAGTHALADSAFRALTPRGGEIGPRLRGDDNDFGV